MLAAVEYCHSLYRNMMFHGCSDPVAMNVRTAHAESSVIGHDSALLDNKDNNLQLYCLA